MPHHSATFSPMKVGNIKLNKHLIIDQQPEELLNWIRKLDLRFWLKHTLTLQPLLAFMKLDSLDMLASSLNKLPRKHFEYIEASLIGFAVLTNKFDLQGFLYHKGNQGEATHDVPFFFRQAREHPEAATLNAECLKLVKHYISSRYPTFSNPNAPSGLYSLPEALEAIRIAKATLEFLASAVAQLIDK